MTESWNFGIPKSENGCLIVVSKVHAHRTRREVAYDKGENHKSTSSEVLLKKGRLDARTE